MLLPRCLLWLSALTERKGKPFMPVLVLNSSLQPLSVIPERRLIVLLSKQKVTFVDETACGSTPNTS